MLRSKGLRFGTLRLVPIDRATVSALVSKPDASLSVDLLDPVRMWMAVAKADGSLPQRRGCR